MNPHSYPKKYWHNSDRDGNWFDGRKNIPPRVVKRAGFVYLLRFGGYHKIGMTLRSVEKRLADFRWLPEVPTLVHSFAVNDASGCEKELHSMFADKRVNGEWFRLDADDVQYFKRITGQFLY